MISRGAALALALGAALLVRPAAAQELTVYNAQHESLGKAWAEGFTRETGIKVTIRKGSDTELANQIVQEGKASPADLFLTENSPGMALVDKSGLFAAVAPETLALVPQTARPASGHWVGIAARSTVLAYDTRKLKPDALPKSMLDLADPTWKGRWAASPSGADFQAIVAALLEIKGEAATVDWLKAMKANVKPYRGNGAAMKGVDVGDVEAALIYHYYWFGDRAKTGENSKNVALHYFRGGDPGAFVSLSGGGVLASSKQPAAAQAFLRWIVGKGGQDILRTGDSFEYAIATGATSNPALEPMAALQAPPVEPAKLDSRKVTDLMLAAGLL